MIILYVRDIYLYLYFELTSWFCLCNNISADSIRGYQKSYLNSLSIPCLCIEWFPTVWMAVSSLYVLPPQKSWQDKDPWPQEAAEVFYLIGSCQMEMRDYLSAQDGFNSAIQVDRKLAEVSWLFNHAYMCDVFIRQLKGNAL